MKRFWNVMGCIAASLFSIVLILVLISFPLYRSVIAFAQPKTLTKLVQNIDYQSLLPSAEELQESLGADWVEPELIQNLIQSDAVKRILELYSADIVNSALQNEEKAQLTSEALQEIIEEEMDSLVEIVLPYIPEEENVSKNELIEEIKEVLSGGTEDLLAFLPTFEEITASSDSSSFEDLEGDSKERAGDDMADLLEGVRFLLAPTITIVFVVIIAFLALLIFFCRFNKTFSGLLWLGVDSAIVSLIVTLFAIVSGNLPLSLLPEEVAPFVQPMTAILSGKLTVFAIIYLVVAILLIAGYIVVRRARKAKTVTVDQVVAEPIAESVAE